MTPVFKIGKSDRIYIDTKFLCNSHWLCTRDVAASYVGPKALKPLLSMKEGAYLEGIGAPVTNGSMPDFAQIIPHREGFIPVGLSPCGVEFRGSDSDVIMAYKFRAENPETKEGFELAVAHNYVPLLRLGHVFAKDARSPVIVLGGSTLNDELLAVIMPYRIGN